MRYRGEAKPESGLENNIKLNRLRNSRAYRKARSMVKSTIDSPSQLLELVNKAQHKVSNNDKSGRLSEVIDKTTTSFRLIKAYALGEYREVSLESLALIVASAFYFVMPLDVIPDFLLGLGFIDDAALLAWTLKSVSVDIERFSDWEQEDNEDQPKD